MSYGAAAKGKGKGAAKSGPYSSKDRDPGDDSCKVYVGNLSYKT
eukprot:CAMPEP_0179249408 /NCGR_PEP_ID=MMETSP0797-20121207/20632_1 /TAXON_ID=47934 /ORGANISM="Dinophysis acuminata, Strain DAEP01" /LENGTH=43 /DNA_ID= /DNA_START= /DNA_END= /DNA_ORIENTATION=